MVPVANRHDNGSLMMASVVFQTERRVPSLRQLGKRVHQEWSPLGGGRCQSRVIRPLDSLHIFPDADGQGSGPAGNKSRWHLTPAPSIYRA